jgi:hypothetical protein
LPLAKTKEEKKSSFPLWGNRKEKNQRKKLFFPKGNKRRGKKKFPEGSFFLSSRFFLPKEETKLRTFGEREKISGF